ncbi:hypothetical protein AA14337_3235 [Acetobacter malorum DSM 14337]|uniref:Phage protein n=1 Tax=Acetobacter malorum DSM 14337 TaxID=1307910 RepID=A0ABQ0Q0F5_9PROT|nr:hypothetical protein [Acetobacter malorum]KXV09863.1 hypothetical protein AD930_02220 [Acetobacter malorum]GBQ86078.1 hypothetical protein AA14337_3235 [Acetobacter malorum DSM 14337]
MTHVESALANFSPFVDDGVCITLPDLTIENASDKVSITHHGEVLDITRDKDGLKHARTLVDEMTGAADEASAAIHTIAAACLISLQNDAECIPDKIKIKPTIELPGDPFS